MIIYPGRAPVAQGGLFDWSSSCSGLRLNGNAEDAKLHKGSMIEPQLTDIKQNRARCDQGWAEGRERESSRQYAGQVSDANKLMIRLGSDSTKFDCSTLSTSLQADEQIMHKDKRSLSGVEGESNIGGSER